MPKVYHNSKMKHLMLLHQEEILSMPVVAATTGLLAIMDDQ